MTNSLLSRRQFLGASTAALLAARLAPLAAAEAAAPPDIRFFDALTEFGPRPAKPARQRWRLDDRRGEMRHCSISGALVSYTQSTEYDPLWGNLELSRQLAGQPGLFAVWNVMPAAGDEFPEPARLAALLREHNVRAVALHPASNAWNLRADSSAPLLTWLAREKILTRISQAELSDFDELAWLLKAHPDLPVLLTGATWSQPRFALPLLTNHRNLHITFDSFQIFNGLEWLVEAGCEDQLLFGSNAPMMSMGAHRACLDYSEVSLVVKRKVAGGNLTRLLRGQAPSRLESNANEDALMRAVRLV